MDDTRNDGAKWRVLVTQMGEKVRQYEEARKRWLYPAITSGEYAQAEADTNTLARDIAGHVVLLMGVEL